ncbi:MAG: 2-oxo-4-hydroxy-4-carboxy-5-ureidoimidazoline decarboxylase [Proteobacteria bacterium]|nr:2-oxo-4-hydroxy-4-carboxy-5-ureidoimidazoline decarboxylase [Pseudomonadota bacterium]
MTLTIAQVAQMDRAAFVAAFGGLFEHSPWVAEAAWDARPFASADALHGAMIAAIRQVPVERRIAFLNAHPELAGKEAEAGTMTDHSTFEQRGLDALSRDEVVELRRLNAAYRARHGFPFIIAVLDHTRAQIVEQLRLRTDRDSAGELAEALAQITRITRRRLRNLLADEPPGAAPIPSSSTQPATGRPQEVRHV